MLLLTAKFFLHKIVIDKLSGLYRASLLDLSLVEKTSCNEILRRMLCCCAYEWVISFMKYGRLACHRQHNSFAVA